MNVEIIMQKLMQIGVLLTSGLFYFVNQIDGSIISQAFDQLFSIGLLVVLVIMIYREWKSSQQYNEQRDERLEKLIENNTEALNNFRDEMRTIHSRINENSSRIDRFQQKTSN